MAQICNGLPAHLFWSGSTPLPIKEFTLGFHHPSPANHFAF
jgi:hypothetical protein